MIYGIGTDIVQIQRIEQLYQKYGQRFVERLLLPSEADAFRGQTRPDNATHIFSPAKRRRIIP